MRVGGVLGVVLLVVIAADMMWGGGHPTLSAVLLFWALTPTLTAFLSRALLGVDFPPLAVALLGLIEYPLVVFGLVSALNRARFRSARIATFGVVLLVAYLGAQVAARVVLNLQSVNLQLVAHANAAVASAAVDRLRSSGDAAAIPALQQRLIEEHERQGWVDNNLLDTLTALGGARGWQNLLESGRLGVAGPDARTWRAIVQNVREMSENPYYADARGGVKSDHLGEGDVAQLFESLALKLAQRSSTESDSEAALTLLYVMKGRPELCAKHFAVVPNGLRDRTPQAALDLAGTLALIKAGPSADGLYDYQATLVKNEKARLATDRDAFADEWIAWAKSTTPLCR